MWPLNGKRKEMMIELTLFPIFQLNSSRIIVLILFSTSLKLYHSCETFKSMTPGLMASSLHTFRKSRCFVHHISISVVIKRSRLFMH